MRYQIIPVYADDGKQTDEIGWVVINPAGFRVSIVYSVDALWLAERQCDFLQAELEHVSSLAREQDKTVALNTNGRFPGVVMSVHDKHVLIDAGQGEVWAVEIFLLNQAGITLREGNRVKLSYIDGYMIDLAPPVSGNSWSPPSPSMRAY
ncbi:hypothetical protein [Silvimonas iriomotensis]|uniref:Uncharacterized protein n=1 Tax=Silvimonas iriomotensis TaxID=449662 RepID=A0ABQ2P9N5_9NEIS|nr:hypothetical protein [Silvimonas iriomotensis]GGP21200.1 hypothetical protein GCM10010970_19310 [Silvimonas iriomotensis]